MRKFRSVALLLLATVLLFVGQAGMANSAKAKGATATGDGTVTLSTGTYRFNFSGQTVGKGGFTIFDVTDRKNLVTAGKTTCFYQIDPNTIAIVGTASNKNTDPAFNTSPYVLIIAQDSPDAISITGAHRTPTCPTAIPSGATPVPITGSITISGT